MAAFTVTVKEGKGSMRYKTLLLPYHSPHTGAGPLPPRKLPPGYASESTENAHLAAPIQYLHGVYEFRKWIRDRGAKIAKVPSRSFPPPDILKFGVLKLNYYLILFVNDLWNRSDRCSPDTIYYLCLGIQCYLHANLRTEHLFFDKGFTRFISAMDNIVKCFVILHMDAHYLTTCIEEEHLWESKQLGGHSPAIILNTVMYFIIRYFSLNSITHLRELSFARFTIRHKRARGALSSRNGESKVVRFNSPSKSTLINRQKVFELHQDVFNPSRCPVAFFELYLSRCPDDLKERDDVLFLKPKPSIEDIAVGTTWYYPKPLSDDILQQMYYRIRTTWEVNYELAKLLP